MKSRPPIFSPGPGFDPPDGITESPERPQFQSDRYLPLPILEGQLPFLARRGQLKSIEYESLAVAASGTQAFIVNDSYTEWVIVYDVSVYATAFPQAVALPSFEFALSTVIDWPAVTPTASQLWEVKGHAPIPPTTTGAAFSAAGFSDAQRLSQSIVLPPRTGVSMTAGLTDCFLNISARKIVLVEDSIK